MAFVTHHLTTDQTDSVAPAVRTMTKWAEQCSADTGVASWIAGRRRRPQDENTDNILFWQATARTSLRRKNRKIISVILTRLVYLTQLQQ